MLHRHLIKGPLSLPAKVGKQSAYTVPKTLATEMRMQDPDQEAPIRSRMPNLMLSPFN